MPPVPQTSLQRIGLNALEAHAAGDHLLPRLLGEVARPDLMGQDGTGLLKIKDKDLLKSAKCWGKD